MRYFNYQIKIESENKRILFQFNTSEESGIERKIDLNRNKCDICFFNEM